MPILFTLVAGFYVWIKNKSTSIFYVVLSARYGSVNSKRVIPPGDLSSICGAGRFIKKAHAGAFKSVQMPHPETIPKFHFPANKLQMPNLLESVII